MKLFCKVIAAALLFGVLEVAGAHTTVSGTTPADGAVLERSPPKIEIRFAEAARVTSVMVSAKAQPERRLAFEPRGPATTFTLPEPNLTAGRNEIRWKALSRDGHVIEGSLVLVVQPGKPLTKTDASDASRR